MSTFPKLSSEAVMETCSILNILSPKSSPRIIEGNEARKAFQNYRFENIESHLSFISKRGAIKISQTNNYLPLKLSAIEDIKVNHKNLGNLME
ncbi:MAG: hypothetical protein M3162_02055 [Thermoproteota archaeon]|nr:hypothetical protein [Thermoproteota archaeon]